VELGNRGSLVRDRIPLYVRRFFVDPLAVKELSGISRRWQTYIGRCLYAGLIGLIIWIFWNTMIRRGGWMSPSAYAELGRNLYHSFFALQMVVVTLGGMSAGADMITREIRGGTLGLLALTPLTPWRIVAGKWKAAVIQTSTALLCGGPVFAVCIYLGGAGLWEFTYSATLSVLCAALGAALSILYSTVFRASYVVTIVTLVTLLVYCIGPVLLFAMFRFEEAVMSFLVFVHPLYAAIAVSAQGSMGFKWQWAYGWIGAAVVTSLIIHVLLRASANRVRALIRLPGGRAPEPPSLDHLRRGPVAAGPRVSRFAKFFRGRGGVWERRAILWKELSTRRVGAGKAARLGAALLVFVLLTTMGTEGWWRVLILWFTSFVLALVALANGVSLFVTEREERKWDILLSTPLTATEIVLAKLVAGLAGLAPMAIIMAGFWSFMALVYGVPPAAAGMSLAGVGLFVLFTYLLAAFTSLNASTQRGAFSSAFGILLGLLCVLPILAFMFQSYRVFPTSVDYAEYIVGSTNPGTYLVVVSDAFSRSGRWEGWREGLNSQVRELVPMFLVYVGSYSALVVGLILWMVHRFDRATGRS
jgi:ABC-type transport system involved in multi-copper enzyme maturation permease subunit